MMGLISIKTSSFYNKNIWDIQEKHLVFTISIFTISTKYLLMISHIVILIWLWYAEMCMKKIVILLLLSCFTYESKSIDWRKSAIDQASAMTYDQLEREVRRPIAGYHQEVQKILKKGYTHAFNIRKQRKELAEEKPLGELFQEIKNIDPPHDLDMLNVIYLKRKSEQDDALISQIPSLISKIEEMSKEIKSLKEQNTELQQQHNDLVNRLYYD